MKKSGIAIGIIAALIVLFFYNAFQPKSENTEEVRSMKFDIPGIRAFSGLALKEAYSTSTGKSVSIEGLFNLSGVPYGNRIAREENFVENYQRQMSEIFENPNQLRESLLEIMSKEEWAKPKPFVEMKIRARPIDLKGRQMDLHTLMCNYSTYEYNKNNRLTASKTHKKI